VASLAIDARELTKTFGARPAVEGLSFQVEEGEVFGLLGPNGAGKTTTVRMLTGLLQPSSGDATVLGLDVRTGAERLRRAVGLLTEQPGLYDRLTAEENLRFFIKLNELDEPAAWARARRYLERFQTHWSDGRWEPIELREQGDHVFMPARLRLVGRKSGIEVDRVWIYVFTLRDGKLLRQDGYDDPAEGLRAAGIEDQPAE
jgi:ABC-type sugar transport system ATPase subunit